MPTYLTARARPSKSLPMKLCSVSGLKGKYLHPQRKARFHGRKQYHALENIPTAALTAYKGVAGLHPR